MAHDYKYKKVLLVDDNEIDIFVNLKMMEKSNFAENIIIKNSEEAALNYIKNECKSDDEFPDLIFLNPAISPERKTEMLNKFKQIQKVEGKNKIILLSVMDDLAKDDFTKKRAAIFKSINKPLTYEQLAKI